MNSNPHNLPRWIELTDPVTRKTVPLLCVCCENVVESTGNPVPRMGIFDSRMGVICGECQKLVIYPISTPQGESNA